MQIFKKQNDSFEKFGKYTILKKLNAGGMAEIYLANDPGPTGVNRFVVIKKTLTQFSMKKEFKDMFKTEGMVACNLKHRNIVPMYEFGIEGNQFFLSLEYISGRNLREMLRKLKKVNTQLPVQHAVYIAKEIASGLDYAHNVVDAATGRPLSLIHRDVSPQNIMLSFDGEIKLIDFGIAKIADTNLTQVGHLKGKFGYMSPEQTRGEKLDPKTDIFCLGIILWEMLSNERLFSAKNEMESLKKIRACNVPDLRKVNPHIPSELVKITGRALNKNRNTRYKTAAEFERDLTVFLNSAYPKFSQYDFNAFIKKICSQDILTERENLKSYSVKIKKRLKSLTDSLMTADEDIQQKSITMPVMDDETVNETETWYSEDASKDLTNVTALSLSKEAEEKRDESKILDRQKTGALGLKKAVGAEDISSGEDPTPSPSKRRRERGDSGSDKFISISQSEQINQFSKSRTIGLTKEAHVRQIHSAQSAQPVRATVSRHIPEWEPEDKKVNRWLWISIGIGALGVFFWIITHISEIATSPFFHELVSKTKNPEPVRTPTSSSLPRGQENTSSIVAPQTGQKQAVQGENMFIQTEPSGAEIYINGRPVSHSPSVVFVPLSSTITIQKNHYFPRSFKTKSPLPNRIRIKLNKKPEDRPRGRVRVIE